jgi:methionyl aminopeptidase
MHEEPQVPNFGRPHTGPELKSGMVLAIEPMLNVGTHAVTFDADKWTVRTADGSLSAHFEHTVAITDDGPEILTLAEGAR